MDDFYGLTSEERKERIEEAIAHAKNVIAATYPCEVVRNIENEYSHYYKDSPYTKIDVYRVLELFNVTHPCIQHAIKKLLVMGGRGNKNDQQDIQEAISSLTRWQEMKKEEKVLL